MATIRCSVDDPTKARFTRARAQTPGKVNVTTTSAFFNTMLEAYEHPVKTITLEDVVQLLGLTPDEHAELDEAVHVGRFDLRGLLRIGVLRQAREACSQARNVQAMVTNGALETSHRGIGGAGIAKVDVAVRAAMRANEQATSRADRWYITNRWLAENYALSYRSIQEWMAQHADALQAHHVAMGFLTPSEGFKHNTEKGRLLKKIADVASGSHEI